MLLHLQRVHQFFSEGAELQINNAIFYLNSYFCEAQSSPEMFVLFMSVREARNKSFSTLCVCLYGRVSSSNVSANVCMCMRMFGLMCTFLGDICIPVRLKGN